MINEHRILVVDDEEPVLRANQRALSRAGYVVSGARSGETALEMIDQAAAAGTPFHLAVCDLHLTGIDGLATVAAAWRKAPDLQVVVCTGDDCTIEQLPATDALLVIKKPYQPVELQQAVRALLAKQEHERCAVAAMQDLEHQVVARTQELQTANDALARELARRDRMEAELRLSQRLEAVGQLAAGVAHEINTPIQYVGDNLQFLAEATNELLRLIDQLAAIVTRAADPAIDRDVMDTIADADLAYLRTEAPRACESATHGIGRIASIVSALKELSHPGSREAKEADLNRALEKALEVSASSYRYVADVDSQLTRLPLVRCYPAELGQVFLNLIVNAAHAMENPERRRGRLGVSSRTEGSDVVISISDTGCGIPAEIRERIFDPFFTTKDVGRGTGQGLAIARSIIVERHGGALSLESEVGRGTTFHIRIPIAGPVGARAAAIG